MAAFTTVIINNIINSIVIINTLITIIAYNTWNFFMIIAIITVAIQEAELVQQSSQVVFPFCDLHNLTSAGNLLSSEISADGWSFGSIPAFSTVLHF